MTISTILAKKPVRYTLITAIWLLVWQGVSMLINEEILFVSPLSVVLTLLQLVQEGEFWLSLFASVGRVFGGFVLGYAISFLLASLAHRFSFFKDLISPIISIVKATPVASFIILALMWIGNGIVPVFISMLMVIPIVWSNTLAGLENIDGELVEMAKVFKMPFFKRLRLIYFPSIFPYMLSASGSGLGLCWKAGIAAEVICRSMHSIGNQIWETKYYIQTNEMFAWTAVVVVMSVIFDAIIKKISKAAYKHFATEVVQNEA